MTRDTATAGLDVLAERQRQVEKGYDAAHDDARTTSLVHIAISYLYGFGSLEVIARPFDSKRERRERMVRAAALLVAEIEMLDRQIARAEGAP